MDHKHYFPIVPPVPETAASVITYPDVPKTPIRRGCLAVSIDGKLTVMVTHQDGAMSETKFSGTVLRSDSVTEFPVGTSHTFGIDRFEWFTGCIKMVNPGK